MVEWIHASNKIKNAGFDSRSDTEKATKDVVTTLMLPKETYKPTVFRSKLGMFRSELPVYIGGIER